ncbi:MAG: mycofactocin biosynthesis chaperone MftB [Deltaproteobacteria bacterium]|nr:mycofactocin biosynthesis chaperone MftB [Deltaproteobacteria bacterium]
MEAQRLYRLAAGVQVRREKFGLLFYNYRGPRLYFLASGDLLDEGLFQGERRLGDWVQARPAPAGQPREGIVRRLEQLLHLLEEKGLIHGEPVC